MCVMDVAVELSVYPVLSSAGQESRRLPKLDESKCLMVTSWIYAVHYAIIVGGTLSNALCIRTFSKMGLKQCGTSLFLNLAVSDLSYLAVSAISAALDVETTGAMMTHAHNSAETGSGSVSASVFAAMFRFFPYHLQRMLSDAADLVYNASSFFVTVLAIHRGLSVKWPSLKVKFKGAFSRCLILFIVSSLASSCWMAYHFTRHHPFIIFVRDELSYYVANVSVVVTLKGGVEEGGCCDERSESDWLVAASALLPSPCCALAVLLGVWVVTGILNKSFQFQFQHKTSSSKHSFVSLPNSELLRSLNNGLNEAALSQTEAMSDWKDLATRSNFFKERQTLVQVAILSAFFLLSQLLTAVKLILEHTDESPLQSLSSSTRVLCLELYVTLMSANALIKLHVYHRRDTKSRVVEFEKEI